MGGRILLQDLIQGVAKRAEISEQEAETFVRTVFAVVTEALGDEKIVKIRNLGTFKLVEVGDRETVDAATGATVRVKGYRKIVFTPDNTLKDLINKPFAQFETVVLNEATATADMERGAEPVPGEEEDPDEATEMNEDIPVDDTEESVDMEADVDTATKVDAEAEADGKPETEPQEAVAEENTDAVAETVGEEDTPQTAVPEEQKLDFVADGESPDEPEETPEPTSSGEEESEKEPAGEAEEPSAEEADAEPTAEPACDEPEPAAEENSCTADAEEQQPEEGVPAASIEYQHADYQKVQEQKVDELNVATQNVEHQTIEHQSIVHQGRTENERSGGSLRLTQGGMIALFAFILLLMVGSYLAGYYRVLLPACHVTPEKVSQPAAVESEDTTAVAVQLKQTVAQKTTDTATAAKTEDAKVASRPTASDTKEKQTETRKNASDSLKQLKANAAKYPQVKNGTYLIVGVKSVHKLKSGESLLRLAQKVYGSRDFVKYIIVMNKIKDPDLVQIGTEIKLPQLTKSGDKL